MITGQSMHGYFKHIKNKTYIDKYPREIIRLVELTDKVLVEFGCGIMKQYLRT